MYVISNPLNVFIMLNELKWRKCIETAGDDGGATIDFCKECLKCLRAWCTLSIKFSTVSSRQEILQNFRRLKLWTLKFES